MAARPLHRPLVVIIIVIGTVLGFARGKSDLIRIDAMKNCGLPSNDDQILIGGFAVNYTVSAGSWRFQLRDGVASYHSNASYYWASAVRITPSNCRLLPCGPGPASYCANGVATSTLGSPLVWQTAQAARSANLGAQVVLSLCNETLWFWFEDNYCPDNVGVLEVEATQLR